MGWLFCNTPAPLYRVSKRADGRLQCFECAIEKKSEQACDNFFESIFIELVAGSWTLHRMFMAIEQSYKGKLSPYKS